MIFKKFRIDQLFTVDTSNTYGSNLKDSEIIDDEGTTPYVGKIMEFLDIADMKQIMREMLLH